MLFHTVLSEGVTVSVTCLLFVDVTEPLLVEVDKIYHLACPASPIFYKYNAVKVCTILAISES